MHCTSTLLIPQFTLLYADDTIVLVETEKELQSALDAVHEYCNNIHLTHKKTSHDIFSWKSKTTIRTLCLEAQY